MPYKRLAKILRAHGCEHVRTVGSHEVWKAKGGCTASIPAKREVAPGTLRNIRDHLTPCLGEGWMDK